MVATIFNFLPLASALLSVLAAVLSVFFPLCPHPASVPNASTAAVAIASLCYNADKLKLQLQ